MQLFQSAPSWFE